MFFLPWSWFHIIPHDKQLCKIEWTEHSLYPFHKLPYRNYSEYLKKWACLIHGSTFTHFHRKLSQIASEIMICASVWIIKFAQFYRICLSPRCFAIHSLQCPKKQMHIFVACQWWDAACLMSNSKSLARTEQSASAIWMIFSPYKLWPQEFFSQTIMHCAVGLQVIYVPLKHHEFVILRSSVLMLVS